MARELPLHSLITLEPTALEAKEKYLVTEQILKKITGLSQSDGFAGEVALPKAQDVSKKKHLLILDKIADPGNLGTLLRTALALNWDGVIVTAGTVDLFNDKALRAGKGAQFHLPYAQMTAEEISKLDLQLYTADLKGERLENAVFKEPLGLILNNEAKGPDLWTKKVSQKITIAMNRQVESLNVAISGAILLYAMRPE